MNNLIMMASLFALIVSLLFIVKTLTNTLTIFVDAWMTQADMQRICEDIVAEITYADKIECIQETTTNKKLIIATRRKATILPEEDTTHPKYLAYYNKGSRLYRQELDKSNGSYSELSTQPLHSENFFGNNEIYFYITKLADNLYKLEIKGVTAKTGQTFYMQTIVLQRNGGYYGST